MNVPKWAVLGVIVCLAISLSIVGMPQTAEAAVYPCAFYGTAQVDGAPVDAGTQISAWVAGEQVASTTTGEADLGPDQFVLRVELEGPAEVSFKIGELWAAQTATWVQYGAVEVNLTAFTTVTLVSVAVSPESASIPVGGTQQFTATGTYSDDSTADITAEAAWTSSDETVATVATGLANGVAAGATTITATLEGISGEATLTVTTPSAGLLIDLIEGVNVVPYTGVTTSLPEALTNISDFAEIIWVRAAWTEGDWLYYNVAASWGTLSQLENGKAYILVVIQDCTWVLPE